MTKKLRKLLCIMLFFVMVIALSSTSFAAETLDVSSTTYDLDVMDLEKPFSEVVEYTTPEGDEVIVTNSFEPASQNKARGSDVDTASVGTWKTKVTWPLYTIEYKFDMYRPSASTWGIRNPHDFKPSGTATETIESELTVVRATSSSSFPAKITGSAFVSLFDNQYMQVIEKTYLVSVTVTSGGTVTTEW